MLATLALLTLAAPDALANNAKKYPGVMCRTYSGSSSNDFGRLSNPSSTASASMDCPVVYDETTIASTTSNIQVIDNNATSGYHVTCSLWAIYQVSTTLYGYSSSVSTSSLGSTFGSNAVQTLTFSGAFGSADWEFLGCSLPKTGSGSSMIVAYKVDES